MKKNALLYISALCLLPVCGHAQQASKILNGWVNISESAPVQKGNPKVDKTLKRVTVLYTKEYLDTINNVSGRFKARTTTQIKERHNVDTTVTEEMVFVPADINSQNTTSTATFMLMGTPPVVYTFPIRHHVTEFSPALTDTVSTRHTVSKTTEENMPSIEWKELLNHVYYSNLKAQLYVGINYMPSFAYRNVSVNQALFNQSEAYAYRRNHESSKYGAAFNIQVGATIHASHTVYLEYLQLTQGFNADTTDINWQTGLSSASTIQRQPHSFYNEGMGIGYNYSGYNHLINFAVEFGLYYTWFTRGSAATYQNIYTAERYDNDAAMKAAGLKPNTFGGKFGFGLSARPYYRLEVKLVPMVYYNFTPSNKQLLKTNLYNIGLNAGIAWRFF